MDQYVITDEYSREPVKHGKNNTSTQMIKRKNFLNGVHNALNILNGLERCLQKTSKYEKQMLRCKASHAHAHDWWESEPSESNGAKLPSKGCKKSSRNQINLAESWSTMSIVCLQYQYEELSKRYEELLQAYDARCGALTKCNKMFARFRENTDNAHAQLIQAHKSLLSVGEKYLMLRRNRLIQQQWYEERIEALKRVMQGITDEMQMDLGFEDRSQDTAEPQLEGDTDLLVSEIRRCNSLLLENHHLNAEIGSKYMGMGTLGSY